MSTTELNITKSKLAIILIAVFSILFLLIIRWNGLSGENYRNIIKSDGIGYYNYFPAFINGDIANQKENAPFLVKLNSGRIVNKYFVGTAVAMSPFVLPVILMENNSSEITDFYSEYFQKAISIAALFYLIMGLWAFRKILILYDVEPKIIAFSLFALFFGTNLVYYALIEPSMSHVYSFAFISVFVYLVKKVSIEFNGKDFLLLTISLALIILIRPINGLIVFFVPFLFVGNKESILGLLKSNIKTIILSLLILILVLSIQSYVWHAQSGEFIVWSYGNEGFYFLSPRIFDFLFSFRKGFFLYTPLALLSIIIFAKEYYKERRVLILSLSFLILIIYFLSSWWNWYYGDSFGSRVMLEFLGVIILLFALALNKMKIKSQRITVVIASVLIFFNLFQSYQYYYQIIRPFDMTAEKYVYTLNKWGDKNRQILGGNNDIIQYHKKKPVLIINDSVDLTKNELSNYIDFEYIIQAGNLIDYKSSFIKFSCNIAIEQSNLENVYWQISYHSFKGGEYIAKQFKINEVPLSLGNSRVNNYTFRLPKPINEHDYYKLSIINYSEVEFYLSNFKIEIIGIID